MNNQISVLLTFTLILVSLGVKAQQKPYYDFVIKQTTLFDGSGKDSVICDVAIAGDTIAFVGKLKHKYTATKTINGKKLYLAPGFIDPHTHYNPFLSDENPTERALLRCLSQGVTTVFTGNDGAGPFPIGEALSNWEKLGIGVNVGLFVPHGTIRTRTVGLKSTKISSGQLEKMKELVATGMQEGAFGISTGLFYTPGNYATTEEVVELSKIAAKYGGIYDTHQRDEGDQSVGIINSVKEVLEIGEKANIPVHISHIKTMGASTWGKSSEIIRMIEKAQKEGLQVSASQYPYLASRSHLRSFLLPVWVREGGYQPMRARLQDPSLKDSVLKDIRSIIAKSTGIAEKIYLSTVTDTFLNGKTLAQVAAIWRLTPEEAVVRIALSEASKLSILVHSFGMSESDMINFMVQPWVMICSDGDKGHPRAFGSFAHFIGEYILKRKLMSLSQAIYKSSYLTAKTLHVKKRGLIKEGFYADLFLFDPNTYKANSSYDKAEVLASGVKYLWVNGKLTISNGDLQPVLNGKALRLNIQ